MKFAYLIFVHRDPQQFIRLLQRLDTPDSLFFVHVDKKAAIEAFKKVEAFVDPAKIIWLKRWNIVWAGFNSIKATLHGLEQVAQYPGNVSHVSFISGQDYPLKPIEQYHDFLKQHAGYSFLEYSPLPRPGWQNGGLDRIHYYHVYFKSFKLAFPLVSFLKVKLEHSTQPKWNFLKKLVKYLPSARKFPRPFLKGYQPYEGSSWFTFSGHFVKEILTEIKSNKAFYEFFRYTQCADEIFFQTLLVNRLKGELEKVINNNQRYIEFDNTTGRPFDYTTDHFETLKHSGDFFARKFNMEKSNLLMQKIDEELLQIKKTTIND